MRSFFEPRFGHDFGDVRVHSNAESAESARALNARAYTIGKDIVFGAGQYAPETNEGRQLLSHELTHVVQQASTGDDAVRCSTQDQFRVEGLYEERLAPEHQLEVYFDFDRPKRVSEDAEETADIDPEEASKARRVAAEAVASGVPIIQLYGFASEEGNVTYNWYLAKRRADLVKLIMTKAGLDERSIKAEVVLAKSRGKIEYRYWRAVEMVPGGGPSRRKEGGPKDPRACNASTEKPVLEKAVRDARELIQQAVANYLDHYLSSSLRTIQQDSRNGGGNIMKVINALDNNFANFEKHNNDTERRDTAIQAKQTLEGMFTYLGRTDIQKCGGREYKCCVGDQSACANPDVLVVCEKFFRTPSPGGYGKRVEDLIHESSHGVGKHDRAYFTDRAFRLLKRYQALDNADSLAFFVLELHGRKPPMVPTEKDVRTGCEGIPGITDKQAKERVDMALAWAERWNTWAYQGIGQTYGIPQREMEWAPRFLHYFGQGDRSAMAGVYDRYRKMGKEFDKPFEIFCITDEEQTCDGGAYCTWFLHPVSDTVFICRRFLLTLGEEERIIKIHAALAWLMPGVPAERAEGYPKLAKEYKEVAWGIRD